jgi:hypothetical protein
MRSIVRCNPGEEQGRAWGSSEDGPNRETAPVLLRFDLSGFSCEVGRRMWRARSNSDEIRKAEAQGLYGVLPEKLRNWLFP